VLTKSKGPTVRKYQGPGAREPPHPEKKKERQIGENTEPREDRGRNNIKTQRIGLSATLSTVPQLLPGKKNYPRETQISEGTLARGGDVSERSERKAAELSSRGCLMGNTLTFKAARRG